MSGSFSYWPHAGELSHGVTAEICLQLPGFACRVKSVFVAQCLLFKLLFYERQKKNNVRIILLSGGLPVLVLVL